MKTIKHYLDLIILAIAGLLFYSIKDDIEQFEQQNNE